MTDVRITTTTGANAILEESPYRNCEPTCMVRCSVHNQNIKPTV